MRLQLRSISHANGSLPILEDINLHIEQSKIVRVIGPSGCGKSSLLRIIGGLEKPDR